MANHKSALKRAKQNEVKKARNKIVKTKVKSMTKAVRVVAADEDMSKVLAEAQSVIDKAAKKGVIHRKTAARKISRLGKLVNNRKEVKEV